MNGAALTSKEVNFLVYRYLLEAGFTHTAFVFGAESSLVHSDIPGQEVPIGALVSFIQKGCQFAELEANLTDNVEDVYAEYTSISARDVLTKDVAGLRAAVREAQESASARRLDPLARGPVALSAACLWRLRGHAASVAAVSWSPCSEALASAAADGTVRLWSCAGWEAREDDEDAGEGRGGRGGGKGEGREGGGGGKGEGREGGGGGKGEGRGGGGGGKGEGREGGGGSEGERSECVQVVCRVDGKGNGGSGVASAPDGTSPATASAPDAPPPASQEITLVAWSEDGQQLAAANMEGAIFVYDRAGQLRATLRRHRLGLFALRWNRRGDLLLSAGADGQALVWDVRAGEVRARCASAEAPVLDVDWRTHNVFSVASRDRSISTLRVGEPRPLRCWSGHGADVNSIRWGDAGNRLLASGSDDGTVRLWSLAADRPVRVLEGAAQGVNCVRWGAAGGRVFLAAAGGDGVVRVWDAEGWDLALALDRPGIDVPHVRWNPRRDYLAAADELGQVYVWAVPSGRLVRQLAGDTMVQDVAWDRSGTRLAVCYGGAADARTVVVADLAYDGPERPPAAPDVPEARAPEEGEAPGPEAMDAEGGGEARRGV